MTEKGRRAVGRNELRELRRMKLSRTYGRDGGSGRLRGITVGAIRFAIAPYVLKDTLMVAPAIDSFKGPVSPKAREIARASTMDRRLPPQERHRHPCWRSTYSTRVVQAATPTPASARSQALRRFCFRHKRRTRNLHSLARSAHSSMRNHDSATSTRQLFCAFVRRQHDLHPRKSQCGKKLLERAQRWHQSKIGDAALGVSLVFYKTVDTKNRPKVV